MMMVYSLINVPYASLLGVMTSDGKDRTSLATYRMTFAFSAISNRGFNPSTHASKASSSDKSVFIPEY